MSTEPKYWYVIYVRPKWEKRIAEILIKKKIEAYCPLNKISRPWNDRKKIVFDPLFSSYVFVYVSENQLSEIRQVEGVINFVYWLSKPATIREEEIDTIKKFLDEYESVNIEKIEINLQDKVRIVNGPLMMWEGNVIEIRTTTIKIVLPSLGYALIAEITDRNLEKIRTIKETQSRAV